jgi:hypothetical protein
MQRLFIKKYSVTNKRDCSGDAGSMPVDAEGG